MNFQATHVVSVNGETTRVRADLDVDGCGPLYTRTEWERGLSADWELTDRGLLRCGQVVDGSSYDSIRQVTVTVGNDPTVLGDAATHEELQKWAENVCAEIKDRFSVETLLVRGASHKSIDCDDPEISRWLSSISQSDEWMAYL